MYEMDIGTNHFGRRSEEEGGETQLSTTGVDQEGTNIKKAYSEEERLSKALYWYRHVFNSLKRAIDTIFRLAAKKSSAHANLKVGDFHYYGRGTNKDPKMAATFYQIASGHRDPQASFNLGFMHHIGEGLAKDAGLAKRYYDMAIEQSPDEAFFPASMALFVLDVENTFTYFAGIFPRPFIEIASFILFLFAFFVKYP